MNTRFKLALAMIAGTALGAAGMQGLHAQASKLKAYGVTELEIIDKTAQASYIPAVRKAMASAHGRPLETLGRVVPIEGAAPPKAVGITSWDSVDDAVAFYKSKAYEDLAPQRDKATKVVRRYVVEVEK